MPELLLEVGCEELPATFVRKAYTDLAQKLAARLAELGVGGGETTVLGTPRRLIVAISDVPERQADATKPMRGPGIKAAIQLVVDIDFKIGVKGQIRRIRRWS